MKTPQFTQQQFIDATSSGGLNPAFGTVSGSIAGVGSGAWAAPGLIAPESMTVAFGGTMTGTIGLPNPFGIISSGGVVVHAHGTQTNLDTQTYTVPFGSLIPSTGSVTAYLAATITQIQQTPVPVPGPPPGHPAYNPGFVPAVGYATSVYSIALAAVTGGVDNVNTFELLRTTLTAGQSSVTGYTTAGQVRAPERNAWPVLPVTSGGILSPTQAGYLIAPTAVGITMTLPPASAAAGLVFSFSNSTSGSSTVATTGADTFAGFAASGTSSFTLAASGSASVWANGLSGVYQLLASSQNMTPGVYLGRITVTGSGAVNLVAGTGRIVATGCGAGGGSGGAQATTSGQVSSAGGGGSGAWGSVSISNGLVSLVAVAGGAGAAGVGATNGGAGGQTGLTCGSGPYSGSYFWLPGGGGSSYGVAAAPPYIQGGGGGAGVPTFLGWGAGTATYYLSSGEDGEVGIAMNTSNGAGGDGGCTPFGAGGPRVGTSSPGVAAGGYGGGAAGAMNLGSQAAALSGAAGGAGVLFIDMYTS